MGQEAAAVTPDISSVHSGLSGAGSDVLNAGAGALGAAMASGLAGMGGFPGAAPGFGSGGGGGYDPGAYGGEVGGDGFGGGRVVRKATQAPGTMPVLGAGREAAGFHSDEEDEGAVGGGGVMGAEGLTSPEVFLGGLGVGQGGEMGATPYFTPGLGWGTEGATAGGGEGVAEEEEFGSAEGAFDSGASNAAEVVAGQALGSPSSITDTDVMGTLLGSGVVPGPGLGNVNGSTAVQMPDVGVEDLEDPRVAAPVLHSPRRGPPAPGR